MAQVTEKNPFSSPKGKFFAEGVLEQETICELHRQVYDLLITEFHDRPESLKKITPLMERAFLSGIKLVKKLIDNKIDVWKDKRDFTPEQAEEIKRLRNLRIELSERMEKGISGGL